MRRSDFTLKLISAILLVAIACYIGVYLIRSSSNALQTSRAMMVTAGTSSQTTGYIIRDELVLSGGGSNVASAVENGQKVAKGEVIAVAYGGDSALEQAGQIRTLQMKIRQLRDLAKIGSGNLNAQTVLSLAYAVQHNSFDLLEQLRMNAEAGIFESGAGSYLSTEAEINALSLDLARLESAGGSGQNLTAPESGTFTTVTDGFEGVTIDKILYKKPSEVASLFQTAAQTDAPLGKLVLSTNWYYAAFMDADDAARLETGSTMKINFTKNYSGSLNMTVESVGTAEDGKCVVVFSCDRALTATLSLRELTGEVMFSNDTGILVSKDAVHLDDDNEPFVYVLMGSQIEKAYIRVLCEYSGSYIVTASSDDASFLREGCEIVVRGKGLYEGKVIKQ
jgi:hypothetical protein